MNKIEHDDAYWMALAFLPKIKMWKRHDIIDRFIQKKETIVDFFHSDTQIWSKDYALNLGEISILKEAKNELPNYSFLIEDLLNQGYKLVSYISPDYPEPLKKNLNHTAPILLSTKGNKGLLHEPSIALVGSRKASSISLEFTDTIAKKAVGEKKVVVSGFAKGVDRQALDSTLKYNGKSIIVLPQGITTFKSGFKKYYKQMVNGVLLVISSFHPNAPWSVQLAMARNPIIYGLADEIYVAESNNTGGTWSGVTAGLKRGMSIYVREASRLEKNANNELIQKGATPVDMNGNKLDHSKALEMQTDLIREDQSLDFHEQRIIDLLSNRSYTSRDIIIRLDIQCTPQQLTSFLKKNPKIESVENTKPLKFTLLRKRTQKKLF